MLTFTFNTRALLSFALASAAVSAAPFKPTRRAANGLVNFGYYDDWTWKPLPAEVDTSGLTHILYSFASCSNTTGHISVNDDDTKKKFDGDSEDDSTNLLGGLKQMYLLKQKQRNLKVLLSVGGYTASINGDFNFLSDDGMVKTFVADAVQMIEDFGLDGIDVDYEAIDATTGPLFVSLMTQLRSALDDYATQKSDTPYLLTAAVALSPSTGIDVPTLDKALDFWNAYDMSGSWVKTAEYQSNLKGGPSNVAAGLDAYVTAGATKGKVVMGIPAYGHVFTGASEIGQPATGLVDTPTYATLPSSGDGVHEDLENGASYLYDASAQKITVYDTPGVVKVKAGYVVGNGFAGTMFWTVSDDKTGADSLIKTAADGLGSLDASQNHLSFPKSKYDNIKSNLGQAAPPSTGAPVSSEPPVTSSAPSSEPPVTSSAPPSAPSSDPPAPTTTGSPSSGGCSPFSLTATYTKGDVVSFQGQSYTAQWWTTNVAPGQDIVWSAGGSC
ncbi:hypothetical protein EXIGLDRAFT_783948 [Exidia glandulosa HHB12029]|uniref:GH18 domain-containing protein n=1 Tax=Exidia glandulosa HHB12029 TaxID=1314781 RepID=A0A166MSQ6_EXIGL|nr:hypothetical protein EXIGLDRAFT_783948 [Exidia glandulosa HHB12029]